MAQVVIGEGYAIERELLAILVRARGHTVWPAVDLESIKQCVVIHKPDLIFLDPEIDIDVSSVKVIESLRSLSSARIVALVSSGDPSLEERLLNAGCTGVIRKHKFAVRSFIQRLSEWTRPLQTVVATAEASVESVVPVPTACGAVASSTPEVTPPLSASESVVTPSDLQEEAASNAGIEASEAPSDDEAHSEGEPLDYDPSVINEIRALIGYANKDQIIEKIYSFGDLKAMSPVVTKVMRLTRSSEATIENLEQTIRSDQAISAGVIALANSSAFSRGGPTTSLNRAIVKIGVENIRNTVVRAAAIETMGSLDTSGIIDVASFWRQAVSVAHAVSMIAEKMRPPLQSSDLYLAGLLHDVGRFGLAELFPEAYSRVVEYALESGLALERVELLVFEITHADASRIMLSKWQIPDDITEPVSLHHSSISMIDGFTSTWRRQAFALALAERLVASLRLVGSSELRLSPLHELAKMVGLPMDTIAGLVQNLRNRVADEEASMMFTMRNSRSKGDDDATKSLKPVRLSPLILCEGPSGDGMCFLLRSAFIWDQDANPRIAVLEATEPDSYQGLIKQLLAYEEEHKKTLPVLLVAPDAPTTPPEALGTRPFECYRLPCRREALVDAANRLAKAGGEKGKGESGQAAA